jgi:hypothetical protein
MAMLLLRALTWDGVLPFAPLHSFMLILMVNTVSLIPFKAKENSRLVEGEPIQCGFMDRSSKRSKSEHYWTHDGITFR